MIKARLWCELALGAVSFVLALVTVVWPTWFESLLGESPDGGDGSFERLFSLAWLAAAVLFSALARRDYRRIKLA